MFTQCLYLSLALKPGREYKNAVCLMKIYLYGYRGPKVKKGSPLLLTKLLFLPLKEWVQRSAPSRIGWGT